MKRAFKLFVISDKPHQLNLYIPKEKLVAVVLEHLSLTGYGQVVVNDGLDKPIPNLTITIPTFYPMEETVKMVNRWGERLETILAKHSRLVKEDLAKQIKTLKQYQDEVEYWAGKELISNLDDVYPRYIPKLETLNHSFTHLMEASPCRQNGVAST